MNPENNNHHNHSTQPRRTRPMSFDIKPRERAAVTVPHRQSDGVVAGRARQRTGIVDGIVRTRSSDIVTSASVVEIPSTIIEVPTEAPKTLTEAVVPALAKSPRKKRDLVRLALATAMVIVIGVTGYVSIDTWLTNSKVKAAVASDNQPSSQAQGSTHSKNQEGSDESAIPGNSLNNYHVAADMPRILSIDKLHIKARVLPMSVNDDGSIQAPVNINDSGWYTGSVKPGETGAVFIDGHASGATRMGLFAYLDKLQEGDTLQLQKGDGSTLTYKVVHTEIVPLKDIDMNKILLPYNGVTKGLNLITCTGTWVPKGKTYDHRVVVYTQQL